VARGEYGNEWFAEYRLDRYSAPQLPIPKKTEVQGSVQQKRHLFSRDQFQQSQFNPGMQSPITLDCLGQNGKHDGAAEPYRERTFLSTAQSTRHLHVVTHFCEGILRALPEKFPNSCELDSAGCAIEKGIPQNTFKTLDLLTERRLGHSKFFGGFAKMQCLRDSEELPQMPDLDFIFHMDFV
jgi:hypothetical protein